MKKWMLILMVLVLAMSLIACGGEDASDPAGDPGSSEANSSDTIDLVEVTGNGLALLLPSDIEYLQIDEFGTMIYSNEDRTEVVSVGAFEEDQVSTSTDITEEVLVGALTGEGQHEATLDRTETLEHEGGTSTVGFGQVTLQDGTVADSALQYFFPAEGGGYHVISYLYVTEVEDCLADAIEEVVSSVTPEK